MRPWMTVVVARSVTTTQLERSRAVHLRGYRGGPFLRAIKFSPSASLLDVIHVTRLSPQFSILVRSTVLRMR